MPSSNRTHTNHKRYLRRTRASGFTLVEVLVALFLLSCTALIFGIVYPSGSRARAKADYYAKALAAAQEKMEDSRYEGYASLSVDEPVDTAIADLPNGSLRFTVTQYAANIKKISVVVTWDAHGGAGGVVRVGTLVADYG